MYRLGSLVSKLNIKNSLCSLSSSPFSFRSRLLVTTLPPPAFFVHKKVFQATVVGLEKSTCVGKGRDPFNGKLLATPPRPEGSNQFKPIFLGTGVLNKTLSTQECIHAGGKHNDLDDAGKDTNHRTVFEMLGHWSFGDYFKTQAISWAWEHLMQVYKLSADRMYAMYFGGDEKLSLEDIEARDTGLELLPPARLFSFGCKEGGIKKPLASFTVGLATTVGRLMGNIRAIRKSSPFNYQLVRLYGSTPKKYFRIWWIYPPEGFYKGNSDATYVEGTDLAWVGGIIRDDQAEHVRSYCKEVRAPTSPLSEAKGVSVLIRYAVKHNFLPLVVEIDCKAVADKAMSDIEEAHPIYREMQSLVKEHNVIVYGAYEDVNEIAHLLARLKCEGMHEFKDISEVPLSIQADVKKYLEHEKANKPYYRARGPKKPRNKK